MADRQRCAQVVEWLVIAPRQWRGYPAEEGNPGKLWQDPGCNPQEHAPCERADLAQGPGPTQPASLTRGILLAEVGEWTHGARRHTRYEVIAIDMPEQLVPELMLELFGKILMSHHRLSVGVDTAQLLPEAIELWYHVEKRSGNDGQRAAQAVTGDVEPFQLILVFGRGPRRKAAQDVPRSSFIMVGPAHSAGPQSTLDAVMVLGSDPYARVADGVALLGALEQHLQRGPHHHDAAVEASVDVPPGKELICSCARVRQPIGEVLQLRSTEAQDHQPLILALNEVGARAQQERGIEGGDADSLVSGYHAAAIQRLGERFDIRICPGRRDCEDIRDEGAIYTPALVCNM